jgi:mannose-6-phosphate isomerase-like protein (cupin superfamily)
MYFSKKNLQTKKINNSLKVSEYCLREKNLPIDGAIAYLNGIFGLKINRKFHEMFFVISGKVKIDLEETEYMLEEEDLFIIPPDKAHTIYGYDAKIFIACTPQFNARNIEMIGNPP